jgi:hypothetical protein
LTDEEWDAYQRGDESLIDLLSSAEIRQIFDREDIPLDDE